VKPGSTVNIKVLLRSCAARRSAKSLALQVPANARQPVGDGGRRRPAGQWEARELQVQPLQTRGVPQLLQVLNSARKNNRLYVRLITRDGGAIVKGESLTALPPSVWPSWKPIAAAAASGRSRAAVLGEWEIPTDLAVTGSHTLTLPLED
jgi:hypothetical protein